MFTSPITSISCKSFNSSEATLTALEPLIKAEVSQLPQNDVSLSAATLVRETNATLDSADAEPIGPLANNPVYHFYLPIFCLATVFMYISIWVWNHHRSWAKEHREVKNRLEHWRKIVHSSVSQRLSRRLHEMKWPQQSALPLWRKERTNSMYTARDTFCEKDGRADYSQYASATIPVDFLSSPSPNPIPYSIMRHHKSLNSKLHGQGRRNNRKAWVSHDLRNTNPVTFMHWVTAEPTSSGSSVAGKPCSSTPTIIEPPEQVVFGTNSSEKI